ncbi:MAG: hypothetical protein QNJ89_04935 [Acidimicrobiia bacterium]|nr:hypothetical protein [Acidimicrobiia bacterium]
MADGSDPNWNAWRHEVFGDPYMVWHDGPDFRGLFALCDQDAAQVDRMLRAGVEARDSLAAEAIGQLEPEMPVPRARAALVTAEVAPAGDFALRRAETLFALTGEVRHREDMVAILTGGDHWGVRLRAAIALGKLQPTAELIDALERGAADVEYLVRYHSANSLLGYAGQTADIANHPLFAAIATPREDRMIEAADSKAWAEAAEELAAAARAALQRLE